MLLVPIRGFSYDFEQLFESSVITFDHKIHMLLAKSFDTRMLKHKQENHKHL